MAYFILSPKRREWESILNFENAAVQYKTTRSGILSALIIGYESKWLRFFAHKTCHNVFKCKTMYKSSFDGLKFFLSIQLHPFLQRISLERSSIWNEFFVSFIACNQFQGNKLSTSSAKCTWRKKLFGSCARWYKLSLFLTTTKTNRNTSYFVEMKLYPKWNGPHLLVCWLLLFFEKEINKNTLYFSWPKRELAQQHSPDIIYWCNRVDGYTSLSPFFIYVFSSPSFFIRLESFFHRI